ncbi:MAG TPA: cobalamin biosynthesis protein [Mycobacterium sp.]|nr:cobalamin biosynthesis protein [Mycobacterium sp.]
MFCATGRDGLTVPAGIALGVLADAALADPARAHPVAAFGRLATALESVTYGDSRAAGALHTGLLLAAIGAGGSGLARLAARGGPLCSAVAVAAATWACLGGTSLARTGERMADLLEAADREGENGDLTAARDLLPSLCGRDPEFLDGAGLTRAALESIAENTSDAQVAPLVWAACGGIPGVLLYRAVNTLDAMIGHRSPRYLRFGWAAARLDDVANYAGARLTGVLTALCAPAVRGAPGGALRAWTRDAARHPSPNAGVVEATFAGALGVRLGGPTQYRYELQIRPTLGDGAPPAVSDLRRAVRLSRLVQAAAALVAVTIAVARSGRRVSARR